MCSHKNSNQMSYFIFDFITDYSVTELQNCTTKFIFYDSWKYKQAYILNSLLQVLFVSPVSNSSQIFFPHRSQRSANEWCVFAALRRNNLFLRFFFECQLTMMPAYSALTTTTLESLLIFILRRHSVSQSCDWVAWNLTFTFSWRVLAEIQGYI